MSAIFLNTKDDLYWLFNTHLSGIHFQTVKSFIMVGNEDCPDLIELYSDENPLFGQEPTFTIDFRQDKEKVAC